MLRISGGSLSRGEPWRRSGGAAGLLRTSQSPPILNSWLGWVLTKMDGDNRLQADNLYANNEVLAKDVEV